LIHHPFRHLIFSPTISQLVFNRHLQLQYNGLKYASKCLKPPSERFVATKKVDLYSPPKPKPHTLFLDLDETLIHTCELNQNPQSVISQADERGYVEQFGINVRPFCREFLQRLTNFYDIYAFTASTLPYATAVVKHLDPKGEWFKGILHRGNCMETRNGYYIKDLRIAGGRDPAKALIVDNLSHSFAFHIPNGIPILEWHDDQADTELKFLMSYLIDAVQ